MILIFYHRNIFSKLVPPGFAPPLASNNNDNNYLNSWLATSSLLVTDLDNHFQNFILDWSIRVFDSSIREYQSF